MTSPSPPSDPSHTAIRIIWTHDLPNPLRGLALSRETGALLAWDANDWLYLMSQAGAFQSQAHMPGQLARAVCSDDGSVFAAGGAQGEVWWLTPDLRLAWKQRVPQRILALALDPYGQYLAVADAGGHLSLFDRTGRQRWQVPSTRPLHHLALVPETPSLLGCSDYGLVCCFDLRGEPTWLDGVVAHIGSLAASGDGSRVVLACFTQGLLGYTRTGQKQARQELAEPCRLAALSFDGGLTLVASLSKRLHLLNAAGVVWGIITLDLAPAAIVLGALGDSAVAGLPNGSLVGLELKDQTDKKDAKSG